MPDQKSDISSTIHSLLQQHWGYSGFRPLQEDVITSVITGHDTLALMPTGGGKSICYQVPGLALDGTCLVISPLIALMKDQVEGLRKRNITAYAIFSGMSRKEVINVLKLVTESNCKFLFVSPERLETSLFKEYLPGMGITLIAVDEAHCISQWGYDFRPPYLRIASLRNELPGVPVLALTASATPEVQEDICKRLTATVGAAAPWTVFRQSFERPNLSYSVFEVESKINKVVDVFRNVPGTGVVYCKSRKRTREISELLQMQGIQADFYHAGLDQEERNRKQAEWIANKIRVIVCTNAFGMGIDKPDVRAVVHVDVPDCIENYYQEAGRAGRDGKKAYAVLLYDERELTELENAADTRFPGSKEMKEVYQAVANYLQLPPGTGVGEYYDFDLADFTRKFKLEPASTLYALQALEQEGWISFNEQVFLPSTIQFYSTKDYLYAYERDNPMKEPLIKTLLRTYEGIFDRPVFISEPVIARLMRKDVEQLVKELESLHNASIVQYSPRKEKPQLFFLKNRSRVEDLTVNTVAYQQRKEKYRLRVSQMIKYVNEQDTCRSQFTASYFGDDKVRPCGICDNCLRKKATATSTDDVEHIRNQVFTMLNNGAMPVKELVQSIRGNKEKIWEVIDFLQAEEELILLPNGRVSRKP